MNHCKPPVLCPDCLLSAEAMAETGPPNDRVIMLCKHGPEGDVIGVAAKVGQQIMNWHLEGPMTPEQAEVTGTAIIAALMRAGMTIHPITKQ